jgi:hypothetical protein
MKRGIGRRRSTRRKRGRRRRRIRVAACYLLCQATAASLRTGTLDVSN